MTYAEAKAALTAAGLKETAASNWADYLTRDGRSVTVEEVEKFVTVTLPAQRAKVSARRISRPTLLTTPEEDFGQCPPGGTK